MMRICLIASVMVMVCSLSCSAIKSSFGVDNQEGSASATHRFSISSAGVVDGDISLSSMGVSSRLSVDGDGEVFASESVSGSGEGGLHVLGSGVQGSGQTRLYSSSWATAGASGSSSQISGAGNVVSFSQGTGPCGESGQRATVYGGVLSSQSSMENGDELLASRSMQMSGEAVELEAITSSDGSTRLVSGGVDGGASLSLDTRSLVAPGGGMTVRAAVDGLDVLDEYLGDPGSEDMAVTASGLLLGGEGLGSYRMSALNLKSPYSARRPVKSSTQYLGGSSSSYILTGWRFNTLNPQIRMRLINNRYLAAEGLNADQVRGAITRAAETWDAASRQNLFADSSMVGFDATRVSGNYDGVNAIGWAAFPYTSKSVLASAKTWYSLSKVGGYYTVREFDIKFNNYHSWSTSGASGRIDVESVVLHELGHPLGLGDIYNSALYRRDPSQVMNSYSGIKRTLGNGDRSALLKLYG
ncbi:MAG TPA: hypothetical protein PLI05_08650 [Methanotrichaceae archaeon]|nr:hypothetical protein [Methanotrichaceae archaeon]HQI91741.1 hypothetical protein [Methanotrichaceae archaeon]